MLITSRTAAVAAVVLLAITCSVNLEVTVAEMMVPAAAPGPYTGGGGVYAPSPGPDCFDILINASDCLPFFSPGSNETVPDSPCCPELNALVAGGGAGPTCLCKLLSNPNATGFNIDVKKALKLPALCGLKVNPVGLCKLLGIPISTSSGGPAMSPGPASASGQATASPSASPPGSGASSISISHHNLAYAAGLVALLLSSLLM
ncbi:hypothetical protein Ancab_040415 [Ancistrocladus abbreviatus]